MSDLGGLLRRSYPSPVGASAVRGAHRERYEVWWRGPWAATQNRRWWRLDDVTNSMIRDRAQNVPATLSAGYFADPRGWVHFANGLGDPNEEAVRGSEPHTVLCWFRLLSTDTGAGHLVVRGKDGFGAGWSMALNPTSYSVVLTSPTTAQVTANGSTTFRIGEWQHAAGLLDHGDFIKFYKNGRLEAVTTTTRSNLRSSTKLLRFGDGASDAEGTLRNCEIIEIRTIEAILTDQEIWQLYADGPYVPLRSPTALRPALTTPSLLTSAGFHFASSQIS